MKKIIRYLSILLLLIFVFYLSSCDNQKEETKDTILVILNYGEEFDKVEQIGVQPGTTITLPEPELEDYWFLGFVDDEENYYHYSYDVLEDATGPIQLIGIWENKQEDTVRIINEFIASIPSDLTTLTMNDTLSYQVQVDNYNSLDAEYKKKVTNMQLVFKAQNRIFQLYDVYDINKFLNYVGTEITMDNYDDVISFNEALQKLDADLVAQIPARALLVQAYQRLTRIKDLITSIQNLPDEVTIKDQTAIKAIREELDKVDSADIQYMQDEYDTFVLKEVALNALLEEANNAGKIDNLILALPTRITYDAKSRVNAITQKINLMSEEAKNKLQYLSIYQKAVQELENIEKDVNTVTYCLGEDIFNTEEELMQSFWADFYSFIYYQVGKSVLTNKSVNNVNDFITMANDYDGGRDHLYNLGDNFGKYYLQVSKNDIPENQSTDKFYGYMYQNNRYIDFLNFLYPFFAYWRIDEKCATINTSWADLFDDGWASCVDTCKFFYYTEQTSYVKTARMIDCMTRCANVAYGDLTKTFTNQLTLNQNLLLRGYDFKGWYDNPDFKGSPITEIKKTGKKIILYAKWEVNQEQKDTDEADFCEVMIYNLTTAKAKVNVTTVGYATNYYNTLSENAKKQVLNYNELESIIENNFAKNFENPVNVKVITNLPTKTFNELKTEFLEDFNTFNNTNITDYSELINKNGNYLTKTRDFYNNIEMFTKWSWLPSYFNTLDIYYGVKIQATRIAAFKGGDQEYTCKAIGCYFSLMDATDTQYIKYNFSNASCESQNTFDLQYSVSKNLVQLSYPGYTFVGYYKEATYKNEVKVASEDMPTVLYAKFEKNN